VYLSVVTIKDVDMDLLKEQIELLNGLCGRPGVCATREEFAALRGVLNMLETVDLEKPDL
jgi:hypothetical protein